MGENIRFNVIIPTRERADTLFHSLRTVVAQDYENLAIIVSDNFSQDNTKEVVNSFTDPRIKYINTGRRLSMAHNWEFALGHVTNGWVMFLGDDDGLYVGALSLLNKLIQTYRIEAISSEFGYFLWPGHFEDHIRGTLLVPLTNSVKLKKTRESLKQVFSGNLPCTRLPWLYHGGAASIEAINRARDEKGRFFCSQFPDAYSAMALSFTNDEYLSIEIPIVVNGASKHSNGNAWIRSKEERATTLFKSEDNIPFHQSLILSKSEQILVYECYLQSWHLHHGALNISLKDQLRIATKAAPAELRKEIEKECQAIATKNGFTFVYKGSYFMHRLRRLASALYERYFSVVLRPELIGVENVYDAAVASTYAYKFLRNEVGNITLFLMMNFVRRAFLKTMRAARSKGRR